MADRVGQQLGNYRLTRLLGKGGFAEVYLGEHQRLHTQAAVKVLYARLASHDEVEGFEREAKTVAHLKHPHIVQVLDFDVEEDTPFLVMDYAPNGSLRQRHPKGSSLPLITVIAYVKQVAGALQFAHDQGLIHRDIKAQNMLLGRGNEVLLSDFGIALLVESSRSLSPQEVAGTAAYMAPEQFRGKPRRASDQYALGVVVYEWITGALPFHGSFSEMASQHLFVPPPSLHEQVPMLSSEVEQVVLTALEKDPDKRFASVQAFATALEQAYQSGLAPGAGPMLWTAPPAPATQPLMQAPPLKYAPPPLPGPEAGPPVLLGPNTSVPPLSVSDPQSTPPLSLAGSQSTSGPALLPLRPTDTTRFPPSTQPAIPLKHGISRRMVLVGLAGLVVVGGGATWLVSSNKSSGRTTPSIPEGTILYTYRGHHTIQAGTQEGFVGAVAWSPNGKRIASGSDDWTVQVWDAFNGGHAFTYRGHSTFVQAVAWSPDGKRIASGSADSTVQVWAAADGSHVFTYHGHANNPGGSVNAVAWSPNGKRIASGSDDNTVQVWDAANGGNVYTYQGHTHWVKAVAWSPDGKYIASGSWDHTVQVWNATDGSHIFTYRGHVNNTEGYVLAVAWSPDSKRIASGSGDYTVQVWNAVDGSHVFVYHGHISEVNAVAWSPDGKRIASGSEIPDHTVQVWDAVDGSHAFTYRGHSNVVDAVAWSPDGKYIASGSWDKTVQVWVAG